MLRAVPKPRHKRRVPKKAKRGQFDEITRKKIIERDDGRCQECGLKGEEIHHVLFKSRGGRGVYTNGLLLCHACHRRLHDKTELADKWIVRFHDLYGKNFYKDAWDE